MNERTAPRSIEQYLTALRTELEQALEHGPLGQRKVIVQSLIEEITVDSRAAIQPTFRVPAVRPVYRSMELGGLEPPTSWVRSRRSPN